MDEGKRFSLLYLDRSKTLRDSQRFRNRLAAFYSEYLHKLHENQIIKAVQIEIGAEIPVVYMGYNFSEFFKKAKLRDLLDSITVIYNVIIDSSFRGGAEEWKQFVHKLLSE